MSAPIAGEDSFSDEVVKCSTENVHMCADSATDCGEPVACGGTSDAPLFIVLYLACTEHPGDETDITKEPYVLD